MSDMYLDSLALDQAVQILISLGPERLKTNCDAYTFVQIVKDRFQHDVDKYQYFLNIFKEFNAQRIDTRGVALEVKKLFTEHEDMFLRFTTFLPPMYRREFCTEDTQEAVHYLHRVKTLGNDDVYKVFINILMKFKEHIISLPEVCHQVSIVFEDHPDLLEGFYHFVPLCQDSTHHIHPHENIAGDEDMEENGDENMEENGDDETESEWVIITYLLEEITL